MEVVPWNGYYYMMINGLDLNNFKEFGNRKSVYVRFAQWCEKGTLARLAETVSDNQCLEVLFLDLTAPLSVTVNMRQVFKKRMAAGRRTLAWRLTIKFMLLWMGWETPFLCF